jgi:hypothetical protein
MNSKKEKPLYGTIPYYSGSWSVTFQKEKSGTGNGETSHYLSGYGDFPFEKYPNIPVINYRDNDAVFKKPDYCVKEATINPLPNNTLPLKDYLTVLSSYGIEIINKTAVGL